MMAPDYDLIIRGGTVIDGLGGKARRADVAIANGLIAAIGPLNDACAEETIDAKGCIVTPGFVDVHTHYDGQAIWSSSLSPSSLHGVTTVVIGNCGVGFAPCRAEDRDLLVSVMEGVEDIPEVVMTAGLPWTWESFPEYLEAIDSRPHDVDIAAYVPHSALRVFVMGERGARREAATADDRARMAQLVDEAMEAGALGFATGSVPVHRTSTGDFIPTFGAAESELQAIAEVIARRGSGVMQVLVDIASQPVGPGMALLERLAHTSGGLVTFSLAQVDQQPQGWREVLDILERANGDGGLSLKGQVFPRPVGILLGHDLTLNPFRLCPSYEPIAELPLPEKVARLRDPTLRAALLTEMPTDPTQPLFVMARNFERMFVMKSAPDYEPPFEDSIAALAAAAGRAPEEVAYDLMLEDEGHTLLYLAIANYSDGTLAPTLEMMQHPDTILGLGDGGAHYGLVCDASFPTFLLTHWTRDRAGERMTLPAAIRALTHDPAQAIGLDDRGRLAIGYKADVNVIDYDNLTLHRPIVAYDLPSGGRRLVQTASGIVASVLSGVVTYRGGTATGALPGQLIRKGRKSG